jgi:putative intracellular protease/amidase
MSLIDHLHPDTEAGDYEEHPRYWRCRDFEVEIHRYSQRPNAYEGTLRVKGSLMTMVGPDSLQKVARELEKTLLTVRPELQEILDPPRPRSVLERIMEEP